MATSRDNDIERNGPSDMREGDWICAECKSHNYSARVTCYRCCITKERSEFLSKGKKALDWECFGCKLSNFSWRQECYRCAISKRKSDDMRQSSGTATWFCRFCDVSNYPDKMVCFKCERPRNCCSGEPGRPRSPSPLLVRSRHSPAPPTLYAAASVSAEDTEQYEEWRCDTCGTFNGVRRKDCYKCLTPKIKDSCSAPVLGCKDSRPAVNTRDEAALEWICKKCDYNNFLWRKECFKCRQHKHSSNIAGITKDSDVKNPPSSPAKPLNRLSSRPLKLSVSPLKRGLLPTPGDEAESSKVKKFKISSDMGSDVQRWTCGYCHTEMLAVRSDCYRCGRENTSEASNSSRCMYCGEPKPSENARCDFCDYTEAESGVAKGKDRTDSMLGGGPNKRSMEDTRGSEGAREPSRAANNPQFSERNTRDWICQLCGINNFYKRYDCYRCHEPKLGMHAERAPATTEMYNEMCSRPRKEEGDIWPPNHVRSPGDWMCSGCRGLNFARRSACYRCEAEKSKSNKYEDDWTCPKCNFNNFARRTACYKCKTSKHASVVAVSAE